MQYCIVNLQNLARNEPDQECEPKPYKAYGELVHMTPYGDVYSQIYVENFLFAWASTTFTT